MQTTRPKVRLVKVIPEGNASVYARWDASRYAPRGTADVKVEVATDVWRPQHWALLEGLKDGRLWLCSSTGAMEPTSGVPQMKTNSAHMPKLHAVIAHPHVKPKGLEPPKPSADFLARHGR